MGATMVLLVRVATLLAVLASCSGATGGEARPTPGEERATGPTPDEPSETVGEPEAPLREPDPDSRCGRALACCRAFVRAMPDVSEASACAGIFEVQDQAVADQRCGAMMGGWRTTLEHLSGEPPPTCQ